MMKNHMQIGERLTKKYNFYRLEWKHPETRRWVEIYADIPAPSVAYLREMFDFHGSWAVRSYIAFDEEFDRLSYLRTDWRVKPKSKTTDDIIIHKVSETDFEITMPDGVTYTHDQICIVYSQILDHCLRDRT